MRKIAFISLVLLFLVACSGKYDELAQCMTERGVTFYGAFWCPHCANQKQILGTSMKHINYVECSLPDKSGQTEVCKQANITNYPTWEFQDGTRAAGVQQPEQLSQKSGCKLE
jgi:glutaredoxin